MRKLRRNVFVVALFLAACLTSAACDRQPTPAAGPATGSPEAYVPGLGEMMSLQQMRHVKLWFAGQAENWDLAAYEVDELGEASTTSSSFTRRTRIRRA